MSRPSREGTRPLSRLLYAGNPGGRGRLVLYGLIYVGLLAGGGYFLVSDSGNPALNDSFLHLINLVFHEAGHVLFRPFGDFMAVLGGSLMQLLVPLVFVLAFLFRQRDTFGAAVCLWWLGQSMMDLVPYIADARLQQMWLLGGVRGRDMPGIHDWHAILSRLGLLEYDQGVAMLVATSGRLLILLALVWGALLLRILYRQQQDSKNRSQ